MKTVRRFVAAAVAGLLTVGLPALGAPFGDLTGRTLFFANALGTRNVLPTVWGGVLAPAAPLIRYELAWVLSALMDPREHPFNVTAWPDVPPGYWALQSINRVVGVGLMKDDNGRFVGDRRVRRDEFVESLDKLLKYRAIPPPPPRSRPITFPDARGEVLDRAANGWQFLDSAPRFRPTELITREEAVDMLAKAAPLVDRSFLSLLTPPTPAPTPKPTEFITQVSTESPGVEPTALASESPRVDIDWPPIAWQWRALPAAVAVGLSIDSQVFKNVSYFAPGGGDVDLEGASGPISGAGHVSFRIFPQQGASLTQFQVAGEGLWALPVGQGLQAGVGAGAAFNLQNLPGSTLANRSFVSVGPAARVRISADPLIFDLASQVRVGAILGAGGGAGFGVGYQGGGRYPIPGILIEAFAGIRGEFAAADSITALLVGVGGGF